MYNIDYAPRYTPKRLQQDKEVYCINCSYFRRPEYFSDYCAAPTGEIIKDYIYGDYKERIDLYPDSDNYPNKRDTNGCTYYKRKWWKFWVRE